MRIHKEGHNIICCSLIISVVIIALCVWLLPAPVTWAVAGVALLKNIFVLSFFRCPDRALIEDRNIVFSPADGEIVVIEEVEEGEYFNDKRIQISVFMSIWNIHVNWFPVGGKVDYFRHHHGRYMVAWHPKSSEENERTTTVVDMGGRKILFRQIAGIMARRIVSYAKVGSTAGQNTQCGFIKFGSRVDIFLPVGTEVKVKLGDKVTGTQTIIAEFNTSE